MEGRLLAHRYEVGAVIGRGGAGTVYRAVDLRTGGTVAVKVLTVPPGWRARHDDLVREARRARAL
jgi:hypothetical protein